MSILGLVLGLFWRRFPKDIRLSCCLLGGVLISGETKSNAGMSQLGSVALRIELLVGSSDFPILSLMSVLMVFSVPRVPFAFHLLAARVEVITDKPWAGGG